VNFILLFAGQRRGKEWKRVLLYERKHLKSSNYRKEVVSLPNKGFPPFRFLVIAGLRLKALLCAPFRKRSIEKRAGLTVEAAVVLPVFLVCMLAVLHILNVYNCAERLSAAIAQTAEEMSIGAYSSEYHETDSLLGVVLSSVYASGRVAMAAGDTSSIKNGQFLLSRFLEEDDLIDLVMTWQIRSPVGMVSIPGVFFVQRGAVRGWTGREGSGGEEAASGEDQDHTTVYVAENGTVYHRDLNCTHIKLSIMPVSKEEAKKLRNVYREKYHPCEICGKKASGTVYITTDGNRYHASLECSGLKRTIHEMTLSDAGNLKPCSRCGGIHN